MDKLQHNPSLDRLLQWIQSHTGVERYVYEQSVRTVLEAIEVSGFKKSDFVKTLILQNKKTLDLVALIIPAGTKADKRAIKDGVNPKKWVFTSPDLIYSTLGFAAGGVPPVCISDKLETFVDPRVLRREFVIGGGGTINSLIKLKPELILEDGASEKIVSYG